MPVSVVAVGVSAPAASVVVAVVVVSVLVVSAVASAARAVRQLAVAAQVRAGCIARVREASVAVGPLSESDQSADPRRAAGLRSCEPAEMAG